MANKLIHYNSKQNFETDKDSITDHSLVFIQDSEEIYTHSEIYKGISWSVLEKTLEDVLEFPLRLYEGYNDPEKLKKYYNYFISLNIDDTDGDGYFISFASHPEIFQDYKKVIYINDQYYSTSVHLNDGQLHFTNTTVNTHTIQGDYSGDILDMSLNSEGYLSILWD